jgi:hypothetical protein
LYCGLGNHKLSEVSRTALSVDVESVRAPIISLGEENSLLRAQKESTQKSSFTKKLLIGKFNKIS